MVLLALGAWMLSSLTSQSGFVMNNATPRTSKVAMRGFKDDFYAWKETLSSEDQALLLKQAQNEAWQLSVLGLLMAVAFVRCPKGALWSCADPACVLKSFSRRIFHDVSKMMLFFFKLPLLLSIRFHKTLLSSHMFQRKLNNCLSPAFLRTLLVDNITFG